MVAAQIVQIALPRAEAEILALMLADLCLAQRCEWPVPVPLLATAIAHPTLRSGGSRPRPGDGDWAIACTAAYGRAAVAAHGSAVELMHRADRLQAAAARVRTRNRARGVAQLLADDAVAPAALVGPGSERAARRFCERLAALGGISELTGRASFRLYGL
jgi:hypothetical protein